jgi:hypothetical protein
MAYRGKDFLQSAVLKIECKLVSHTEKQSECDLCG